MATKNDRLSYTLQTGNQRMERHHYWVYILTNRSGGLHVGLTNDLVRRVSEHCNGEVPGFTSRYRMYHLVYYEEFKYVNDAISRECQLKGWRRAKKIRLIQSYNPDWLDLAEQEPGLCASGEPKGRRDEFSLEGG
jgi:putative endonuclease